MKKEKIGKIGKKEKNQRTGRMFDRITSFCRDTGNSRRLGYPESTLGANKIATLSIDKMTTIMGFLRKTFKTGKKAVRGIGRTTMKVERKGESLVRTVGKAAIGVEKRGESVVRKVGKAAIGVEKRGESVVRKVGRKSRRVLGLSKKKSARRSHRR